MFQSLRQDKGGFTLLEIMIVVAIIGLLAAIAVPSFMRARMRAQASTILNEFRQVDAAKDQYGLENNKKDTDPVSWADATPHLKAGSRLATGGGTDLLGNGFSGGVPPTVGMRLVVSASTKAALSAAVDNTFWGPYS